MFKPFAGYWSDGYKLGHKRMMAPNAQFLYGTWIPRTLKRAHRFITKAFSFGQQLTVRWLADEFKENFFDRPIEDALLFVKDINLYLGLPYDGDHFIALHKLGYLPVKIKALPEGIETDVNIPHMTFINTKKGYAWLTLYLETIISSLAWKPATSATTALQYTRTTTKYVMKTDPEMKDLIPYLCHDFSARGLDPFTMYASGLGHCAGGHRGSDSLVVIPAARYYYDEPKNEVAINSVNASEHSVSCTKIFTVGEKQMILDWLKEFPIGILSIVADTFDLWKLLMEYLRDPEVKAAILARNGKTVFRPDSGVPADILCGEGDNFADLNETAFKNFSLDQMQTYCLNNNYTSFRKDGKYYKVSETSVKEISIAEFKGAVEILADIFGTDETSTGYKRLHEKVGLIYGDSITIDRQIEIYERLMAKGYSATCTALGIGSYTYQMVTRDTLGFAAKGAWFEVETPLGPTTETKSVGYNIYKDPITGDGTKKSLKGRCAVFEKDNLPGEYYVKEECTEEEENTGLLQVIFEDGKLYNQTTLAKIREATKDLVASTFVAA